MKPGQTVLDRFTLAEPLPASGELIRWTALDQATGQAAGLTALPGAVALRPGAEQRFRRAWSRPAAHPALVEPLVVGLVQGRPAAAHAPLRPLDPDLRLDPAQAVAWASWLAPAALAAEPALAGELGPLDLAVDAEGTLRLAPAGLTPPPTELSPPRFRAPELRAGGAPTTGSALYGLGVLLFRASTGAWPLPARTAAALAAAGPPRRLREVDPGLPEALDGLVAGLLSHDPAQRVAAASSLAPVAPVQVSEALVLRQRDQRPASPVTSAGPAQQPAAARADLPAAPWLVVARSEALTQAARRRAAALLDLDRQALEQAAEVAPWLPLEGAPSRTRAERRAAFLTAQGLPAEVQQGAGGGAAWVRAALLGAAALVGGLAALVALPLAWVLAAGLGLLAALLAVGAVHQVGAARERSALHGARRLLVARPATDPADRVAAELRAARREILEADLAPPLRLHLEEVVEELERRSEQLAASGPAAPLAELRAAVTELRDTTRAHAAVDAPVSGTSTGPAPLSAARAAARERGS